MAEETKKQTEAESGGKKEKGRKDEGKKGKEKAPAERPLMTPQSRLLKQYREEVIPTMMKEFNWDNPYQVPCVEKVVISMGVGEGARDIKILESAMQDLTIIAGQHPVITRARHAHRDHGHAEGQQDVRVPGQAFQPGAAEGARLPGAGSELDGRNGEFHVRDTRATGVPGDRLRRNRPCTRHGYNNHDHEQE
jgi:hypothetical protein